MEPSLIVIVALFAAFYFWSKNRDQEDGVVEAYARALMDASFSLEDDQAHFRQRLEDTAVALRLASNRKRGDWRGQAELMRITFRDVVMAANDERILNAAGLRKGYPGYDATITATNRLTRKLEKLRPLSGWRPNSS